MPEPTHETRGNVILYLSFDPNISTFHFLEARRRLVMKVSVAIPSWRTSHFSSRNIKVGFSKQTTILQITAVILPPFLLQEVNPRKPAIIKKGKSSQSVNLSFYNYLNSNCRSSPKIIKSKGQSERSVYFEAGEEGGEVKLVQPQPGLNNVNKISTIEPSSASSNNQTGARLSLAGNYTSDQTKNVESFSVRTIILIRKVNSFLYLQKL